MGDDYRLIHGDALEVLRTLPDGSADAVVTDPPAGIAFMGKEWDRSASRSAFLDFLTPCLAECLRVAKPGARMLCWAIPRTSHWTGTAVEDAGWIIEDRVSHIFGQGFPKAKSKLKPAVEDWWKARKPSKGVPPLQIDACRVNPGEPVPGGGNGKANHGGRFGGGAAYSGERPRVEQHSSGRWPANLVLSHHPDCNGSCVEGCPVRSLDEMSGERQSGGAPPRRKGMGYHGANGQGEVEGIAGSSGGASRYFPTFSYHPKASRSDRGEGNTHPTVKNTDLMRWLCRLIAPPGGMVLDPFAGSGSTGVAALTEGFRFIGIERDESYFKIASDRLAAATDGRLALTP